MHSYLAWKKSYWSDFIQTNQCKIGDHCLDLGCGPAGIFTVLTNKQVTAVDPLLDEYQQSLAHFDRQMYPSTMFIKSKMECLNVDCDYDTIFCLNALNHVDNLEDAIMSMANVMHGKTQAYVSIDVHRAKYLQQVFKWIPADALHPHQLTSDQYKALFLDAGLVVKSTNLIKRGRIFDYVLFTIKKNRPS